MYVNDYEWIRTFGLCAVQRTGLHGHGHNSWLLDIHSMIKSLKICWAIKFKWHLYGSFMTSLATHRENAFVVQISYSFIFQNSHKYIHLQYTYNSAALRLSWALGQISFRGPWMIVLILIIFFWILCQKFLVCLNHWITTLMLALVLHQTHFIQCEGLHSLVEPLSFYLLLFPIYHCSHFFLGLIWSPLSGCPIRP